MTSCLIHYNPYNNTYGLVRSARCEYEDAYKFFKANVINHFYKSLGSVYGVNKCAICTADVTKCSKANCPTDKELVNIKHRVYTGKPTIRQMMETIQRSTGIIVKEGLAGNAITDIKVQSKNGAVSAQYYILTFLEVGFS